MKRVRADELPSCLQDTVDYEKIRQQILRGPVSLTQVRQIQDERMYKQSRDHLRWATISACTDLLNRKMSYHPLLYYGCEIMTRITSRNENKMQSTGRHSALCIWSRGIYGLVCWFLRCGLMSGHFFLCVRLANVCFENLSEPHAVSR